MENLNTEINDFELTTISSLIAEIHTDATYYVELQLKQEGLTDISASHGFILFILSKNKNDKEELLPMTMKEITKKIDKDKSTTTVLIKKLLSLGYISRNRQKDDGRFTYINLSEKGKSFTEKMAQISKGLSEKFYQGFSEDEKKTVFSLLKKIQSNF